MARDEVEAAYFTLLRARAEVDALQRYSEMLTSEAQRVRRFISEGEALAATVEPRSRRALEISDQEVAERLRARLALIADEQRRLPDRLEAATAFVEECEQTHRLLNEAREASGD